MEKDYYKHDSNEHSFGGLNHTVYNVKFSQSVSNKPALTIIKAYKEQCYDQAFNEFKAMKEANKLSHVACKPYQYHCAEGKCCLVMERIMGIRLSEYAEERSLADLKRNILDICHQLVGCLELMHRSSLHHCNLTADHVIIDEAGNARLIGFSRASKATTSDDVFSFGLMVLSLLIGEDRSTLYGPLIDPNLRRIEADRELQYPVFEMLSIALIRNERSTFTQLLNLLDGRTMSDGARSRDLNLSQSTVQHYALDDSHSLSTSVLDSTMDSVGRNPDIPQEFYQLSLVEKQCAICSEVTDNINCITLQCNHDFHITCLRMHLEGVLQRAVLYTDISCPRKCANLRLGDSSPEPIPMSILTHLQLSSDSLDKAFELQDLGISAQSYSCELSPSMPMCNSSFNAYCTRTYPSGDSYQGDLLNDKPHGYGTMNYVGDNTKTYAGNWVNGTKQGRGVETWPNGDKFEGEFLNDKRQGQGTLTWADGVVYSGSWEDHKYHGRGVFTWPDGRRYEGEFQNGIYNGQGTYRWADGRVYTGSYKDGKKHGRGVLTSPTGERYEGEFQNDNMTGQGTYRWADGEVYTGSYKDDKKHGLGLHAWPNGDRYEGEYQNDFMNGKGTYRWADGKVWSGLFKDRKLHGQGVLVLPDGGRYIGTWKEDKRHGEFTYSKGGTSRRQIWREGVLVSESA
jgi:tRNA A-37 threonylcarbamoyl transferase component Bud32